MAVKIQVKVFDPGELDLSPLASFLVATCTCKYAFYQVYYRFSI